MENMLEVIKNRTELALVNAKQEIRACNEFTERFGLTLNEKEIDELVQCRLDALTDDELIEFMVSVFNGRAQGSTEYLLGTSLNALCRYARNGYDERNLDEVGDLF